jgi:hypothetical protein
MRFDCWPSDGGLCFVELTDGAVDFGCCGVDWPAFWPGSIGVMDRIWSAIAWGSVALLEEFSLWSACR